MATWVCPDCGYEEEARCKPKECPKCDKAVEFAKKESTGGCCGG